VLTDEASARAATAYSQHGDRLNAAIRALPATVASENESSKRAVAPSIGSDGSADSRSVDSTQLVPDAAEESARVTSTTVPENSSDRVLIACVSVGVLVLLLLISVGTVRSITRPVRRFIATTQRLAAGEPGARVPRGGIRELDTLAVAFNEMADQLAAAQAVAREYQSRLEIRVEERTRQLQHLAEHDPLTQLPNRRQLATYLETALAKAAASGGHVGVLFLDLDNFKTINDSMGHAFGDCLLQGIAERLREVAATTGFAARLGGDEFTVVYESAQGIDAVRRIGETLVASFQKPLLIDGRDLVISISVGASVFPEHGTDSESLLRAADAALFNAKASGRSRLSVFSPDLLEAASSKFRIEQGLRRALEHGELELLFQPEVGLETFSITLVEALLRWRLPDGTYVAPSHFLSVAEESGLIMDISDWVLRTAIEAAARWHHGTWPNVRIAVNVSARQLLDGGFVERITELLQIYRLPAQRLEIELTENVLQTAPATVEVLRRLRSAGIAVALDDFGTGYSTLASLEQLPLTRVKLDRSLIDSIDTNERSLAIARAIIGLCQNLGLEVTAEGIERPGQLALLWNCPRMYLQGYLLCKPVSQELLPDIAEGMPKHMQTLLLTSPVTAAATSASLTATSEPPANAASVPDHLLAKQLG
jgi:diguanylate cyclase (GGDEF)-like protein